ncbi:hypothetical protein LTR36_010057 [Oleoguttula mirabilis]|uniref:TFIIS N-terminal domain-containing protein n=1 Tax=Oleoguttula mirabilis TaxID=1507867 RepID=A0AAV9JRB1_9PEZI|nr:hypothetical protein LTR36_010057 [Oleoguttula mirabilis]
MEDLELPPGSPSLHNNEEPQANADPRDPLNPEIDEEDNVRTPPLAQPTADTEVFEDEEATRPDEDLADEGTAAELGDDGEESELEELDEAEFEDFDPSALNIPDKPVAVDADNVGLLGVHKRKRTEDEEREHKKKKKEGRREKPKRSKKVRAGADDDDFEGGVEMDGKRVRKPKAIGGDGAGRAGKSAVRKARTPEVNEEELSPEERRRRALDRKMDEALKTHRPSRRRAGVDLEAMADAEIESMRQRMAKACELDAEARAKGEVATHKLRILPEVVELMNRNTIQSQLVDPDINILEAVRFMLEPADHDAALPNYQIQRELFSILTKLRIGKEALVASGVGKVVLFYTKSIQPQPDIKRQAERLIGEWMRVVLNKPKTHRNKTVETKAYDPVLASQSQRTSGLSQAERASIAAEKRRRVLAQPIPGNRARADGSGLGTYTIAPVNNLSNALLNEHKSGNGEAFRRIAARSAVAGGGKGGSGRR